MPGTGNTIEGLYGHSCESSSAGTGGNGRRVGLTTFVTLEAKQPKEEYYQLPFVEDVSEHCGTEEEEVSDGFGIETVYLGDGDVDGV
jgi:hypothetical protein